MPILENLKEHAERATGLRRPGKRQTSDRAREGPMPHASRTVSSPNHQRWPLIIYGRAIDLDDRHEPRGRVGSKVEQRDQEQRALEAFSLSLCSSLPAAISCSS